MTIAIDATTKSLEVLLAAAKTTNDCTYSIVYHDIAARSKQDFHAEKYSEGNGVTNGTSVVILLVAPPNYTTRNVSHIAVHNADTVNQSVIIRVNYNTGSPVYRNLIRKQLAANETLIYEDGAGWQVL